MHRVATAAVVGTAASMLAAASTFLLVRLDHFPNVFGAQFAAPGTTRAAGATARVAAGQCRRLVGVWTTLGFELTIRPDDTAYDPGDSAIGIMTCVGQSARIHWLGGEEERFAISPNDDRLTQSGAVLGVQYDRASRDIPPDLYGPPAPAPFKALDLSGL